jgi:hypothetical protein
MQRLTMLLAATLLTTGCGSKQNDAAKIEAARTEPAAAALVATAPTLPPRPRSTRKPTAGSRHDRQGHRGPPTGESPRMAELIACRIPDPGLSPESTTIDGCAR